MRDQGRWGGRRWPIYHISRIIHSWLELLALIPKILYKWFIILISPWSLVSNIFLCDAKDQKEKEPLQTQQFPSVFPSYLELQNSTETACFLPFPWWTSAHPICSVCPPGSPSSVRDRHRLSGLCWLCALNYHWQDPVSQLPAVFLACAFTSLSIVKHTMTDFNIVYVPVMIIRGDTPF